MAGTNAFIDKLGQTTSLCQADLEAIAALCSNVSTLAPREVVFTEDATSEHLHIVLDGWAAQYRLLDDGRRHLPALLLPGDICDLDRLQIDRLRFGIVTLTACKIASVSLRRLRSIFEQQLAVRDAFWRLTCLENSILSERAVCLGRRTATERTAHVLCELKSRLDAIHATDKNGYALPLTQLEMADVLGLSVVHLNRILQTLRTKGLIDLEGRFLTILDHQALARLSGFDDGYLHLAA